VLNLNHRFSLLVLFVAVFSFASASISHAGGSFFIGIGKGHHYAHNHSYGGYYFHPGWSRGYWDHRYRKPFYHPKPRVHVYGLDVYRVKPTHGHYKRHRIYRGNVHKPWTRSWHAYCRSKYRSFNPKTGYYLAYSGKYRFCR
jgi:hypothetical protein